MCSFVVPDAKKFGIQKKDKLTSILVSKVKIKVSGCFRTERYAHAWCRISIYLDSMAELGYNPIEAILIALDGNAADMIKQYDWAA